MQYDQNHIPAKFVQIRVTTIKCVQLKYRSIGINEIYAVIHFFFVHVSLILHIFRPSCVFVLW